jgi:hypothetical protein
MLRWLSYVPAQRGAPLPIVTPGASPKAPAAPQADKVGARGAGPGARGLTAGARAARGGRGGRSDPLHLLPAQGVRDLRPALPHRRLVRRERRVAGRPL